MRTDRGTALNKRVNGTYSEGEIGNKRLNEGKAIIDENGPGIKGRGYGGSWEGEKD